MLLCEPATLVRYFDTNVFLKGTLIGINILFARDVTITIFACGAMKIPLIWGAHAGA